MLHPVQQKVAAINRRARRLRTRFAVGLSLSAVVGVAFLLGLADYFVRSQDPGLRLLNSGAVLLVAAASWYRWLRPTWRYRPNDRQVAQRIEQHYPELQDRLSSTIEFLGQAEQDPLAGSAELRRAVIAATTGEVERLDCAQCLDTRPARRTTWIAAAVALLVLGVCVLDVQAALIAVRRLAMPWKSEPWPRRYVLEFIKRPTRVAIGADFESELIAVNGRLPDVVRIFYWFDGDEERNAQVATMKFFADKMVHRLENVRRPFQYRAVGGDDDTMRWTKVAVVEPPHVETLSLRLHPPEYTGWPVEPSGENIVALEGTHVEVSGRLSIPASAVALYTDQRGAADPSTKPPANGAQEQAAPAGPRRTSVWLAADGLEFMILARGDEAWVLRDSGAYWFQVTDLEGLQGGGDRRWNARVVRDAAPAVTLDKPGANTFVTREAVVTLEALVKDDLAIQVVELRYRRSDTGGEKEQTVELARGPDRVPPARASILTGQAPAGESRSVLYAWDLAQLKDLAPGAWIEFTIAARDYKPQVGQSPPRRLTVISAEDLEDRIAARQAYILGQLAEVLQTQREARSQTKSLEIQLETAGQFTPSDVNQLQAAELNQRHVGKLLADPQDGVQTQVTGLLDELSSNRLDSPEVTRRMQELRQVVEQLSQQQLPEIQRGLVNAIKAAGAAKRPGKAEPPSTVLRESLRGAGAKQAEVIELLEKALGEMSQWDSYRRFAREFHRLRQQEQQLRQETEQARLETLGKELNRLSAQEKATLKRLAERQVELARQVDKTQGRMGEMQAGLRDSDPLAAETLADALEIVRRTAVSGQMRECGRDLEQNRVGQAAGTQQEVLDHLQEILDALANRREHELDRRLRKLDEAAGELKQLQQKQQDLQTQLQQAAQRPDPAERQRELQRLSRQQQALAEETQRLARRLQRLQSATAAEALERAAGHQQQAGQACDKADAKSALEQAQQAQKLLDQAERQLQTDRRQAKQDLFQEQMARLEKDVAGLVSRQQSLQRTTVELQALREQQAGQWRREQLASVRDLAAQQRGLSGETAQLAEKTQQAETFALGFRSAGQDMDRAARNLDLAETAQATQAAQQHALERLQQILEALKRDASGEQKPSEKPPGGTPPNQPPGDGIQRLAELKLLRLMQQDVNRRTRELEQTRVRQGSLTEDQSRELTDLAQTQGRLADLLMNLPQPAAGRPEEEPANMPEAGGTADDDGSDSGKPQTKE